MKATTSGRTVAGVARRILVAGLVPLFAGGSCGSRPAGETPGQAAATGGGNLAASATGAAPAAVSPALDTIRAAIVRNHLSELPLDCLVFELQEQPGPVTYDVRERHGGACGGDPAVSPRLFTIAVDTTVWTVSTDAGSPGAGMAPLPHRADTATHRR